MFTYNLSSPSSWKLTQLLSISPLRRKSRILIFCTRRHWTAFVHQTSPHVAAADGWMKRKHHCCFQSFITSTLEPSKRKYRAACELWTRKTDARVLWEIPRKRKLEEISPAASNYSKRSRNFIESLGACKITVRHGLSSSFATPYSSRFSSNCVARNDRK